MTILYIECNTEFSADMLLGAMLDMGASVYYIQNMLKDAGFEAEIMHDTVLRSGMDTEYAYTKCETTPQSPKIPDDVQDVFLKELCIKDASAEEICAVAAACYGVKCFSPDYIMCSRVLGTSDIQKEFLECIVNEEGAAPDGDMICVGYGAGENDVLRAALYSGGSDIEFAQLERYVANKQEEKCGQ